MFFYSRIWKSSKNQEDRRLPYASYLFLWMHFKIFIAWAYSSHPWLWPAYVKSRFAFIRTVEIKSLCLQLKRSGTEYAAQKINFLILAVANGHTLLLWKISLDSDEVLKSYYLFIFSSHKHVQHMTSQILLILIDFDSLFRSVFDLKLLIFKPL